MLVGQSASRWATETGRRFVAVVGVIAVFVAVPTAASVFGNLSAWVPVLVAAVLVAAAFTEGAYETWAEARGETAEAFSISIGASIRQLREKRKQANHWLKEIREGRLDAGTVGKYVELSWLPSIRELLQHRYPSLWQQFEDEADEPLTSPETECEKVFDLVQRYVRRLDRVLSDLEDVQQRLQ